MLASWSTDNCSKQNLLQDLKEAASKGNRWPWKGKKDSSKGWIRHAPQKSSKRFYLKQLFKDLKGVLRSTHMGARYILQWYFMFSCAVKKSFWYMKHFVGFMLQEELKQIFWLDLAWPGLQAGEDMKLSWEMLHWFLNSPEPRRHSAEQRHVSVPTKEEIAQNRSKQRCTWLAYSCCSAFASLVYTWPLFQGERRKTKVSRRKRRTRRIWPSVQLLQCWLQSRCCFIVVVYIFMYVLFARVSMYVLFVCVVSIWCLLQRKGLLKTVFWNLAINLNLCKCWFALLILLGNCEEWRHTFGPKVPNFHHNLLDCQCLSAPVSEATGQEDDDSNSSSLDTNLQKALTPRRQCLGRSLSSDRSAERLGSPLGEAWPESWRWRKHEYSYLVTHLNPPSNLPTTPSRILEWLRILPTRVGGFLCAQFDLDLLALTGGSLSLPGQLSWRCQKRQHRTLCAK